MRFMDFLRFHFFGAISSRKALLFFLLMFCSPVILCSEIGVVEGGFLDTLLSNQIFTLYLIIAVGLSVGAINIFGMKFGSSMVIFVALALGHFGYTIPSGAGTIGLVFFIAIVALDAGPGFFYNFKSEGKNIVFISIVIVVSSILAALSVGYFFDISGPLLAGLLAGAMTSTPALAGASSVYVGDQQSLELLGVAYGIAYLPAVLEVVFFVQLLPKLLKKDLDKMAVELSGPTKENAEIVRQVVKVVNQKIVDEGLKKVRGVMQGHITRVLQGNRMVTTPDDYELKLNDELLIVCQSKHVNGLLIMFGGKGGDMRDYLMDVTRERRNIVATSSRVVGRSIAELKPLTAYGVLVTRIARHEVVMIVDQETVVEYGDSLLTVGDESDLVKFAEFAGHRAKAVDETNISSLAWGILFSAGLGLVTFSIGTASIKLGLVGGTMIFFLLVGHFGHIGSVYASMPRGARNIIMNLGLVFFLANAGINAGGSFLEVLSEHGMKLLFGVAIITFVPLVIGYFVAIFIYKLNFLQMLGSICGAMTSTPGLGAITSKVDSDIPVMSYASAYPVAMILLTVFISVVC